MNSLIQEKLDELKSTWDFTDEELFDIRCTMVDYAMAAHHDSTVMEEVWKESALQGMGF